MEGSHELHGGGRYIMIKVNYFNIEDRYYKETFKPTGRYMLIACDFEDGQDEVEIHSHRVEKVSKEEYEAKHD